MPKKKGPKPSARGQDTENSMSAHLESENPIRLKDPLYHFSFRADVGGPNKFGFDPTSQKTPDLPSIRVGSKTLPFSRSSSSPNQLESG